MKAIPIAAAAFLLAAPATARSADVAALIEARTRAASEAWSPGSGHFSMDAVAPFYVGDERLLAYDQTSPSTTVIRGVDQWRAIWAPFMAGFTDWHFRPMSKIEVRAGRDLAVATFLVEVAGTVIADGSRFEAQGHVTWVWERHDDQWLIGHEHISVPVKLEDKE